MTGFSPIESVSLTVARADGTHVSGALAVFADSVPWERDDGTAETEAAVAELVDAVRAAVKAFNDNDGRLGRSLDLTPF